MTHKGGKKAKKAFHKSLLPKATKEKIENLSHSQLQVLLTFIRALLASSKGHTGRARKGRGKTASKSHSRSRKLTAGVHRVSIRGKMRNVRVLSNGKWRFLKG